MTPLRYAVAIAAAAALLGGCSGRSEMLPGQSIGPAVDRISDAAAIPSCKGQKNTKDYAQSKPQKLSVKGGSVCVPKFKNWGGKVIYPSFTGPGVSMTVISSTTAYDPGGFPPSTDALFYLQLKFSGFIKFGTKLAAGLTLGGPGLKPKTTYTIEAAKDVGSLWQVLPYCYVTTMPGKYGPMLGGLGFPLKGGDFASYNDAVIMIYRGKLVKTKC